VDDRLGAGRTSKPVRTARPVRIALVLVALVLVVPAPAEAATIKPVPVATELAFPAAFTFARDGRIFYGERFSGEIRIFDPATGADSLFFTIPNVAATGEQGLLGLTLHYAYPKTPYVFAYVTRVVGGVARNQLVRITDTGGTGSAMWAFFTVPAASAHNGGRILFGADRKIYAVVGDNGPPSNAQNLGVNLGKVLRMNPTGTVPSDNPFAGSLVWAYGIRNSFGFAFDPQTGRLWETENGPTCNDELNRIVKGRNYGWGPSQTCDVPPEPPLNTNQDGPNPFLPQVWWESPIAPTGAAFCSRCGLGSANEGRLFVGTWRTRELRRVTLGSLRWSAVGERVVYTHDNGILSLEVAPGGAIYMSDPTAIYKLVLLP
jgi:glucose/arabinose dehydrogenase